MSLIKRTGARGSAGFGRVLAMVTVLIAGSLSALAADPFQPPFSLRTLEWRYQGGDDLEWSDSRFDDSRWSAVRLTEQLSSGVAADKAGFAWFRVRIPAEVVQRYKRPMLFLGRIQNADQTYVNGQLIGSTGTFVTSARDYAGTATGLITRAYLLPQAEQDLVLALRVQALEGAPELSGPVLIGDAHQVSALARRSDIGLWLRDSFMLTALAIGTALGAIIAYGAGSDRRHRWLPWFLGSLLVASVPYTITGYYAGLSTSALVWLGECLPYLAFGLLHFLSVLGIPFGRVLPGLMIGYYGILIAIWVVNPDVSQFIFWSFALYALPGLSALIVFFRLWRAFWSGRVVSKWNYIAVGVIVAMIAGHGLLGASLPAVMDPFSIGIIVLVFCLLMSLADHHRADRRALTKATGALLVAQDTERERIARDLHDELSQRIAATRLRLEALALSGKPIGKDDIASPIEELRETSLSVSAMVEGLDPASLNAMTFGEALTSSVERWQGIAGARLSLSLSGDMRPDPETQVQALRICQEALHNAIRHGKAALIVVTADLKSGVGIVTIRDDGRGFNTDAVPSGIGLRSMTERARLIRARLNITSVPGRGCTVRLEFRGP